MRTFTNCFTMITGFGIGQDRGVNVRERSARAAQHLSAWYLASSMASRVPGLKSPAGVPSAGVVGIFEHLSSMLPMSQACMATALCRPAAGRTAPTCARA